ncbi:MAG: ADP-ribosylglycohydrolase family protein [Clostridia bacterium]|nr:ADP-ribosylglycohydrolase family protein [Clostridia bacterium]
MRNQDKFRGCLIGGAAGDALGYAVEFIREEQIFRRYGEGGITQYDLKGGIARISDDTQMTLFTATGLLLGKTRFMTRGIMGSYAGYINYAYLDWLKTQERRYPLPDEYHYSWLVNVPELFSPRAPGNTCLAALRAGGNGTPVRPINDSKGCGGVMRVAPIGLFFNDRQADVKDICRVGAEAAALTHGHPLGWMPAAALVQIIHEVSQDGALLPDAVGHALNTVDEIYPETKERIAFTNLIKKAIELASEGISDLDAIHQLGEGWVGDEALAIAVYCALRYSGDLDKALIAAVNHNGDSDSTGAITGNIIGAQIGLSGIPAKYTEKLELRDLILEIADDLWHDCQISEYGSECDPVWEQKYIEMTYGKSGRSSQ